MMPTSQAVVRFLFFALYIKIVKLIFPNLFLLSGRALNLQGTIDLNETDISVVL